MVGSWQLGLVRKDALDQEGWKRIRQWLMVRDVPDLPDIYGYKISLDAE